MLTDAELKYLKPKEKPYKITYRDGMYAHVSPGGTVSFRLDYRVNGRRETVNFGRYGRDGISLLRAREICLDAKRAVREGRSPAIEKQRAKRRLKEAKGFGAMAGRWIDDAPMADSTRSMRRAILERDLLPVWRNRLLNEITPDDLRALTSSPASCPKVTNRRMTALPLTGLTADSLLPPQPGCHPWAIATSAFGNWQKCRRTAGMRREAGVGAGLVIEIV